MVRRLLVLLLLGAPVLHAQGRAPSYAAAQFRCVRVHERLVSDVTTETGTQRATARTGREGALVVAGRPDTAGIDVLAWYDTLAVWREVAGDSLAADTDGLLGGHFRGTLRADGRVTTWRRPFVPTGVQELSDVGSTLEGLFAPLPSHALQVGEEWRAGDTLGVQRLADSAGAERYRVQRTLQGRVSPVEGDSVTPAFERTLSERGLLVWHPTRGALRWERRMEVEALVPPGGAVKRAVRSRIEQRATVAWNGEDPRACAGLRPDD